MCCRLTCLPCDASSLPSRRCSALFQTSRLSGDCLSMLKAAGMRVASSSSSDARHAVSTPDIACALAKDQDVPADIRSALLVPAHLSTHIAHGAASLLCDSQYQHTGF
eukprot:1793790-Rhodomonas_salina.1